MSMRFWSVLALAAATTGLAACGQQAEETTQAPEAAPEGLPGITITNGRLVLPAVTGNPAALYFDISNAPDSAIPVLVRGVSVDGAGSAMFHETTEADGVMSMGPVDQLEISPGSTISLAPGGYHVMAMELAETLAAGDTTEVTLTFEGGDKTSFPAEVRAAGDAGVADMGAMD